MLRERCVKVDGCSTNSSATAIASSAIGPRIEGLFARIERWTRLEDGDVHWRSISRDNILTVYGSDADRGSPIPTSPGTSSVG